MQSLRSLAICALPLLCAVLSACDESLSTVAGPTPNLTPNFASVQREVFESTDAAGRLNCTLCHTDAGGRTPSGGLNLRSADISYAQLVGVASRGKPGAVRVIPGDPANSYLIHKLEGRSDIAGVRMPRGTGPYLQAGQMMILKRWIELGARND